MSEPPELNRSVLDVVDRLVAPVRADQLDRPTPCTKWSLGDLLRHMVGQHRGFAAAARGDRTALDSRVWEGEALGPDPAVTYLAAAAEARAAFAEPGLLDRRMHIYGYGIFPARVALAMHAVDYLAHGWDVARSIGHSGELPDDLCEAGIAIARRWPNTEATWGGPESPFQRRIDVPDDARPYQRLMGLLGRDPGWRPPV
jgi:uncharacterized protein (TIGR03086 family)